ncbi:MAG: TIGR01777 family oxidoreductase [Panacagrimonas sp.]
MHTLITGGSGFIGRALTAKLLADGHGISVLTRDPASAQRTLGSQVRAVRSLDEVGVIDSVFNLQGENLAAGRWTDARKRAFVVSRIDFTRELLAWMSRSSQRPVVLVNGSAIGWYGDRGDETLTESSTPGDDFAAQLCRDWESAALKAEGLGIRVCRVRTGVVLDRDGGALAKMLPAFRLGAGGPIGSGRQWMSWITRRDLVRLLVWLAQTPTLSGAFNGTAPVPVRQADFARALAGALHRPAVLPMPAFALRMLFGGEMAGLLLGGQRVLPQAALSLGFSFEHADIGSAMRAVWG